MQEHEEMLRLQREAKAAKKQKSAENLRLQQKRKAAERTARKLLHDARSEAARLSKQSRIEKELTAAPVASETQGQSVLNPRQKGRRPPRSNPVVVIMKGGRIVRSGVKQ
jgi:regulator of protease activity HflC (stomatin/prohibitin superfamily)